MSSSITARSSSRQSKDNTKLPGGLDQYSVEVDSAEKKNRRKPLVKFGSYENDGAGYLSFDSDGENEWNTSKKISKKKKKKKEEDTVVKNAEDDCKLLALYYLLFYLTLLSQLILIIIHVKPIHSRSCF